MEKLTFKDKIAYSTKFDDIYFNTNSPLLESEYVFASALNDIWSKQDSFIVAEAGFGTGLNFLTLANKFKNSDKKLHYVSIEKYPLTKKELIQVYQNLNTFEKESNKLVKCYPTLKIDGLYRIHFSKNIVLDLYIGDIKDALNELDFIADVWFLDGFAPSKNPDMWDSDVIYEISNLTKKDGVIATYSSASSVRKNLENAGFEVKLVSGYGNKREMIKAYLKEKINVQKNIWYSRPAVGGLNKKVLVIGGGIAGLSAALKFKKAGFKVKLTEKDTKVGSNGSGNIAGVLMPTITKKGILLGRMHLNAFLQAFKFYKKYISKEYIYLTGSKEYAFNSSLVERYKDSSEFFKFSEVDAPYPSIFVKEGILARPNMLCAHLATKIDVLYEHEFISFEKKSKEYEVYFKNGNKINTDIIIFALGSESEELFGKGLKPKMNFDESLKISSVRGQVTWIKETLKNRYPLSAKGYICPAIDNIQLIGATYDRNNYEKKPVDKDNIKNIENISDLIDNYKNIEIIGSQVGFRSYSGDRFPIVGPIHDKEWFKVNYKDIFWTKNKTSNLKPKHLENIYITTSHGARGLGTSILGAELLLDYVLNRPFCIEKSIVNELNPARFLIRELKKGKIK
ncbi:bifunctional 5-methylaminomethyl-2-thiouridine-forming methyltransferase / FAD-dependent demodification enzyme [Campylobacter blaseri]|uniref:Bifunctional tRNA (5-methylaminomethyl-2-thiouridine)(34)-methyltransferase MnmD/FAD-dependent 5-carboxymethylaminomethyl-2-thiouridine(34) oxidoreductase MnmC n=1 Tax=Campylobacter blaseri TaxID=2042961 RepID=A0A2P8R036_9BACT|nr:bifunctional tRNA (5-methylaminomethyl-2-thiouridine)(34)-methyltransferase MnmD/FAD-dependent 5-carboxymethylaminomethyl-2-thiouridine(34) oxidoreductase MnmC [Campylobacter blaseri]PSM51842.1 bifunctional tRNA (5-methylaminomethyl-2-thiouridine)(34)-methyltransferase MnmD/FAD-dependent 5-carboxymethylaminomethyl-2-thiouridine(34) oxidoreductase MnmC [Campylobacter blaseri]PSM53633.1 bifunctional tRNA (5-methylaminomethyl-2-thiouridine)(34)-methyltransferase MnmD/FAD-dependent 5-carboxymethyl